MTTVINLIAGPGTGKSTMSADIYSRMKRKGLNVELVREVAKEWVWEGRKIGPFEQIAIIGEQIKRESSLFGKVDYIITDSPALLGAFYFEYNHGPLFMNSFIKDYYKFSEKNGIKFENYIIPRSNEIYDTKGRYETLQEALVIDEALCNYMLAEQYGHYVFIGSDYEKIVENILKDIL